VHSIAWKSDSSGKLQELTLLVGKGVPDATARLSAAERSSKLETEPNHYAVLGVPSTATAADIRQAFRCECMS
jgi:DnaJ-class molecular chaperone